MTSVFSFHSTPGSLLITTASRIVRIVRIVRPTHSCWPSDEGMQMISLSYHLRSHHGTFFCRLLIHAPKMVPNDANEIVSMAGKYNLGGYIKSGSPGLIIVEGLEFNCDIFMDNVERQKKTFKKAGKVSERSGRAFPMELAKLEGGSAMEDFKKACASVKLTDALEKVLVDDDL